MTDRHAILDEYQPAPKWMSDYVSALARLCQHQRPLRVVVAPQAWFDTISGAVEGGLMQLARQSR